MLCPKCKEYPLDESYVHRGMWLKCAACGYVTFVKHLGHDGQDTEAVPSRTPNELPRSLGGARATQVGPTIASFWRRFFAYMVDMAIIAILGAILVVVIGLAVMSSDSEEGSTGEYASLGVAELFLIGLLLGGLFLGPIYFIAGNGYGGTPGKRLLGLRVRGEKSEDDIGLARGAIRYLIFIIGGIPFYLGWLSLAWDERRQAWHDKAAGSIVIRVR